MRTEARKDEDSGGEDVRVMAEEPGEEPLKTLWLATSRRKSAQRIGTETGANWKSQSKLWEPKPRGMILEPEQDKEDPSVVRSLTPEVEEETSDGKTKTEAQGSTRNWQEESLS